MPATVTSTKIGLAELFGSVPGIREAVPFEPPRTANLPLVSVMTAGHQARGLETPRNRQGLTDPLGGRIRIWQFSVRLWVSLKTDPLKAQDEIDSLLPALVMALDVNPSLVGIVPAGSELEDCTLERSEVGVMADQTGAPLMVALCDCLASWTEPVP